MGEHVEGRGLFGAGVFLIGIGFVHGVTRLPPECR
jgi:hypothetical protein